MIINEEIEIPDDNPFQNDKLSREVIADNLEKIIASRNGSLVLSIDAAWGNGKTTFINMWRKKLDQTNRYKTLYFNAWENDDCGDPLLALIGEIEAVLTKDEKHSSTIEKIKKTGQPLLKKALPFILKMATGGMLDIEGVDLGASNAKHITDLAGKLGEFELHKEQKMSKSKFKEALIEYQKIEDKKIIFFIDELDRCRPTFAVETLEKIKHLFNIDDFIFVLALDKQQLAHSIKTLYGQDMDSVGYLRRFIDFEFLLPEPDRTTYSEFLLAKFALCNSDTKFFEHYLIAAIETYNLSLRDIEKLFYYLSLVIPSSPLFIRNIPQNQEYKQIYREVLGVIYAIFPVIKIKDTGVYQKFVNKDKIGVNEILTMPFETDDRVFRNHNAILNKIIALNNMIKNTNMTKVTFDNFVVGEEGYRDNTFNMSYLLSEDRTEFFFMKQLEFVDNFVMPDNHN